MTRHVLWSRESRVINTDPQRRCYYGCNFSEATVWGPWGVLYELDSAEAAAESIASWKRLGRKTCEFIALPEGETPK